MESKSNPFEKMAPINTKRASEVIYEQIREMIIKGELKPGDRLPSEQNMIELFHRSRPTIREALRMLEHSGYIRASAGSNGAEVLAPSDKNVEQSVEDALRIGLVSLEEMTEYRKVGEVAVAGWAAERRTQEDLDAMQVHLDRMENCLDDYAAFIDMDPQFHALLAAAAKNTVADVVNRILSRVNRSLMKGKMGTLTPEAQQAMSSKVHQMHLAIFQAVKSGDPEQARQAMQDHLTAFETDLRKTP